MNKQELIERIKRLDESYLKTEFVLKLIEQLDEPKPVQVPQLWRKLSSITRDRTLHYMMRLVKKTSTNNTMSG